MTSPKTLRGKYFHNFYKTKFVRYKIQKNLKIIHLSFFYFILLFLLFLLYIYHSFINLLLCKLTQEVVDNVIMYNYILFEIRSWNVLPSKFLTWGWISNLNLELKSYGLKTWLWYLKVSTRAKKFNAAWKKSQNHAITHSYKHANFGLKG